MQGEKGARAQDPAPHLWKSRRQGETSERDQRKLQAEEEREGAGSNQWSQRQPMFGGGRGLDIYPGEEEILDLATGTSWRPPFSLAPESAGCPSFFVTSLPDVRPGSNFILREEFHRRPALWPHPMAQWESHEQQRVIFLLECWQLTALGTVPFLPGVEEGLKIRRS